jgi:hypothetical protein
MKKLKINEDVAITDPALAQQYSNGKQQLVNKDSQINALNKQILKLQQDKIKIQQAIDQIEKKSAETIGKPAATPDANQTKDTQNTDLAKAQQALAAQVLMNKPTTESIYINNLTSKLEMLKEISESSLGVDANIELEINRIKSEIDYLNEGFENPFASNVFYNVSEAYEDIDDREYVIYVEIEDKDNKFMAKIFKRSPDSKWFGKIIYGTSRTFENITYEADYEEDDILNFLINTYTKVRILSKEEFNNYKEDDIFYKE